MVYERGNFDVKNSKGLKDCPILRQIYAWHWIVLSTLYNAVKKYNNKERGKTMMSIAPISTNIF